MGNWSNSPLRNKLQVTQVLVTHPIKWSVSIANVSHALIRLHVSASQWKILPPFTGNLENDASVDSDRIIIQPNKDSDFLAVSQDIVISPDKVFLTKNLQVWTFQQADSDQIYEWDSWCLLQLLFLILIIRIKSNLGRDNPRATFPLLGTDEDFKVKILVDIDE